MKSRYWITIVVILITINFLLLYRNYILRKQMRVNLDSWRRISLPIKKIPKFSLYDLNGIKHDSEKIISSSPYTLLVFFSPTDCASCLYEKELWKRISKEGKIKIIGIGRHIDRRELKEWVENSEIDFLVLYDVNSQVTKKFRIKRTPLKVLVNNRGIIKLVDRVRLIPSEQEEFLHHFF